MSYSCRGHSIQGNTGTFSEQVIASIRPYIAYDSRCGMSDVAFHTAPPTGGPSCIDYEKVFDGADRGFWKLMGHSGIPEKFTSINQNSYEGLTCSVVHKGQLTAGFPVRTGVRQSCLLSPFLFLLAIYWIMKQSKSQHRNGIGRWKSQSQLDDPDFADDLALLSHTEQQMQEKTSMPSEY